ncbi:MAG TPA: hypothetical protein VK875_08075 [Euzebyales bacterium]|nr:hypothetical protein [Euzebyales bacterium]
MTCARGEAYDAVITTALAAAVAEDDTGATELVDTREASVPGAGGGASE